MRVNVPHPAGELAELVTLRSRAHVPKDCAPFDLLLKPVPKMGRMGHSAKGQAAKLQRASWLQRNSLPAQIFYQAPQELKIENGGKIEDNVQKTMLKNV